MGNKIEWATLDNTESIELKNNSDNIGIHTISNSDKSFDFVSPVFFDKEYEFNSWEVEGFTEFDSINSDYIIFKNSVLNYKPGYITEVKVYHISPRLVFTSDTPDPTNIILAKHVGNEMTILGIGEFSHSVANEFTVFKISDKDVKLDSAFCGDSRNAISFIFTSRYNPEGDDALNLAWRKGSTITDTLMHDLIVAGYGNGLIEENPPEKMSPTIYTSRSKFDEASQQFVHNFSGSSEIQDTFGTLKYSLKVSSSLIEDMGEHIFKDFRQYHITNTYKSKIEEIEAKLPKGYVEAPSLFPKDKQIINRCFSRAYLSHQTISNNDSIDIYGKKIKSIKIAFNTNSSWASGHDRQWQNNLNNKNFTLYLSFIPKVFEYVTGLSPIFWAISNFNLNKTISGNDIIFEADLSSSKIFYPKKGEIISNSSTGGIWVRIQDEDSGNHTTDQIVCKTYDGLQVSPEDKIYLHSFQNTAEKDEYVNLTADIKIEFEMDNIVEMLYENNIKMTQEINEINNILDQQIQENEELVKQIQENEEQIEILNKSLKELICDDTYEISSAANDNYQFCRCILKGEDSPNTRIIKGDYNGNYYLKSIKFLTTTAHEGEAVPLYLALKLNGKNYYSTNAITLAGINISPEWFFAIKDWIILDGSDLEMALITEIPADKETNISELINGNHRLKSRVLQSSTGTTLYRPGYSGGNFTPRILFSFKYGKIYD